MEVKILELGRGLLGRRLLGRDLLEKDVLESGLLESGLWSKNLLVRGPVGQLGVRTLVGIKILVELVLVEDNPDPKITRRNPEFTCGVVVGGLKRKRVPWWVVLY